MDSDYRDGKFHIVCIDKFSNENRTDSCEFFNIVKISIIIFQVLSAKDY